MQFQQCQPVYESGLYIIRVWAGYVPPLVKARVWIAHDLLTCEIKGKDVPIVMADSKVESVQLQRAGGRVIA